MIELKVGRHPFELPIVIEKTEVLPDSYAMVKIPVGRTPSDTRLTLQAHIYRGKNPGPAILLLGGVHGDEINGIEIVNQLIYEKAFNNIHAGTIIAIPLLNVFGFNNFRRAMPDGKDVNRSFPGIMNGSYAARIARILSKAIMPYIDYAIDFHTGGDSRYNYPQTRFTKTDVISMQMAQLFNAPFMIQQPLIVKSFRKTCKDMGISSLVFEGGESVRLDGLSIQYGKEGTLKVLNALNLLKVKSNTEHNGDTILILKSAWIRAQQSGIFIWEKSSGQYIEKGEPLGTIHDPYGTRMTTIFSKHSGHIIGHNNASVVNQGDAIFHIGLLEETITPNQTF